MRLPFWDAKGLPGKVTSLGQLGHLMLEISNA